MLGLYQPHIEQIGFQLAPTDCHTKNDRSGQGTTSTSIVIIPIIFNISGQCNAILPNRI